MSLEEEPAIPVMKTALCCEKPVLMSLSAPAAQTSLEATAATPFRTTPFPGIGTAVHAEPFQCSATCPTAHTSVVDIAAAAYSSLFVVSGFGVG